MPNAAIYQRSAKLADDFGWSFACRRFGQDAMNAIAELLPRYASGKNKGKVKGRIVWWKAMTSGYASVVCTGVREGSVCRVQLHLGVGDDSSELCFGDAYMNQSGTLDVERLRDFHDAIERGKIKISKIF